MNSVPHCRQRKTANSSKEKTNLSLSEGTQRLTTHYCDFKCSSFLFMYFYITVGPDHIAGCKFLSYFVVSVKLFEYFYCLDFLYCNHLFLHIYFLPSPFINAVVACHLILCPLLREDAAVSLPSLMVVANTNSIYWHFKSLACFCTEVSATLLQLIDESVSIVSLAETPF